MELLLDGYRRFRADTWPQQRKRYQDLAKGGQQPPVMVIACSDSRVDPATIFSAVPGEIFTVRMGALSLTCAFILLPLLPSFPYAMLIVPFYAFGAGTLFLELLDRLAGGGATTLTLGEIEERWRAGGLQGSLACG